MVGLKELSEGMEAIGLKGADVCVHASLRSFGGLDGGAETLLRVFLDSGCTVMAPSFSHGYEISPPGRFCIARNGLDEGDTPAGETGGIYCPASNVLSVESMGVFPMTMLQTPGRVRGAHPLNSFVALGTDARFLLEGQSGREVYQPFEQLCRRDGWVLLAGVGMEKATILHYAEQCAGRRPFIRWARGGTGEAEAVAIGGCSRGFGRLSEALRDIERTVQVGQSRWRCYPAKEMVALSREAISSMAEITRCPHPGCARCRDAIQGGPEWDWGAGEEGRFRNSSEMPI